MMDFWNYISNSVTFGNAVQSLLTVFATLVITYLQGKHINISKQTLAITQATAAAAEVAPAAPVTTVVK